MRWTVLRACAFLWLLHSLNRWKWLDGRTHQWPAQSASDAVNCIGRNWIHLHRIYNIHNFKKSFIIQCKTSFKQKRSNLSSAFLWIFWTIESCKDCNVSVVFDSFCLGMISPKNLFKLCKQIEVRIIECWKKVLHYSKIQQILIYTFYVCYRKDSWEFLGTDDKKG